MPLWLQPSDLNLDPTATESQPMHLSVHLSTGAWGLHSIRVGKNIPHKGVCHLQILSAWLVVLNRCHQNWLQHLLSGRCSWTGLLWPHLVWWALFGPVGTVWLSAWLSLLMMSNMYAPDLEGRSVYKRIPHNFSMQVDCFWVSDASNLQSQQGQDQKSCCPSCHRTASYWNWLFGLKLSDGQTCQWPWGPAELDTWALKAHKIRGTLQMTRMEKIVECFYS